MKDNKFGMLLCFVCGLLDATCFVALGGTFVGLMTGNLILMGVTIGGGAGGVSPAVFLYPLSGYAIGALMAGLLFKVREPSQAERGGLWLAWLLLLIVTLCVWLLTVNANTVAGWVVVTLTALYMGFQSAVLYLSKRVTITTNVMTSTLTSFLADYPLQAVAKEVSWHKFFALIGFLLGAIAGALMASTDLRYAFTLAVMVALIAIAGMVKPETHPRG